MKKTLWMVVVLVAMAIGASAQQSRVEIKSDPNRSGSNLFAYPGPSHQLTPAPAGYKPFYLSHYGRHGSRYLIGKGAYDNPYQTLLHADSLGKLTPKGKEVLEYVRQIRQEAMNRDGELTLRGAEQHRQIAHRMYERFPEVFSGEANIDAKSTTVIRCILSMENALQELVSLNPQLNIRHDASRHDMYYMNQPDKKLDKQKWAGGSYDAWKEFRSHHDDYSHLMGVLFDSDYWKSIPKKKQTDLANQLQQLACNVQSTELRHQISLYDIFSEQEIYDLWLCQNAFWYLTYGPNELNGGTQPFSQRNLLRKIITEADSCIALEKPGATLRYGHDTMVMPLTCLLNLNGYGNPIDKLEDLDDKGWLDYHIFPMACNIQFVFYRRYFGDKDVLVKVLENEDEARLPIKTDMFPYYRWKDVRAYYLNKLDSYKD